MFNRVVGDSALELDFAAMLDQLPDVASFAHNSAGVAFKIEYRTTDGRIVDYFPDFMVKTSDGKVWIVETKGRVDIEDAPNWRRLVRWCEEATRAGNVVFDRYPCGRLGDKPICLFRRGCDDVQRARAVAPCSKACRPTTPRT